MPVDPFDVPVGCPCCAHIPFAISLTLLLVSVALLVVAIVLHRWFGWIEIIFFSVLTVGFSRATLVTLREFNRVKRWRWCDVPRDIAVGVRGWYWHRQL
jgi:hypothetical protein